MTFSWDGITADFSFGDVTADFSVGGQFTGDVLTVDKLLLTFNWDGNYY